MTIDVGASIIVLIPAIELKEEELIWNTLLYSDVKSLPIQSTKKSYIGYIGIINTNPMLSNVKSSMHVSDYVSEFNSHHYSYTVKFASDTTWISIIITWHIIFVGKTTGVQVWRSGDGYRDVYSNLLKLC